MLETFREERLLENAVARGAELTAGLERIAAEDDRIGDIRGPGLMVGVEFVRDRTTREPDGQLPDRLSAACADAGLLVLTCGRSHEVIRWLPPIDVTAAEIAEAVEIFGETLTRESPSWTCAPLRLLGASWPRSAACSPVCHGRLLPGRTQVASTVSTPSLRRTP